MAKKNQSSTKDKNYKTEDLEEILKRKKLQNKMFEDLLKNATDKIHSDKNADKSGK